MKPPMCAYRHCSRGPADHSGVLCADHYRVVDRLVPERRTGDWPDGSFVLDAGRLTDVELEIVAHQVEADAFPLFLAAWNWCGLDYLRRLGEES